MRRKGDTIWSQERTLTDVQPRARSRERKGQGSRRVQEGGWSSALCLEDDGHCWERQSGTPRTPPTRHSQIMISSRMMIPTMIKMRIFMSCGALRAQSVGAPRTGRIAHISPSTTFACELGWHHVGSPGQIQRGRLSRDRKRVRLYSRRISAVWAVPLTRLSLQVRQILSSDVRAHQKGSTGQTRQALHDRPSHSPFVHLVQVVPLIETQCGKWRRSGSIEVPSHNAP